MKRKNEKQKIKRDWKRKKELRRKSDMFGTNS